MKLPILVQAHKETGALVTMKTIVNKSSGEEREVGTIMVRQNAISGLAGIGRLSKRVAFITLEKDVVDILSPLLADNAPFPVEGKLVVEETLTPYVKSDGTLQTPKQNVQTGAVMTYQGQPVYRNTFFTEDVKVQDTFLRDSNSEETEVAPE